MVSSRIHRLFDVCFRFFLSDVIGSKGRFQAIPLVFGHLTCPRLPSELPGTSQAQLKCFPRVNLLHGGHSWKQQCPFKDKPRDGDDDDDVMWCDV